nr:calcium-transporting ATPase 9, plasma membrane-type-like isoform X1 [Ipomoea batatas]
MTSDGDGKGGREDNVTTTSKLNFPFQAVSSSTDAMPDLEAGKADVACASESGGCVDDGSSDPFDIANTKKASVQALKRWRVKCLSEKLKTNLNTGIIGDEDELSKRRNTFGSNTYPTKKGRSFLRFLWEAWQDLTLIILIIAAVASLGLGIETEGLSTGWYDGGSIFFAVFLVIFVTERENMDIIHFIHDNFSDFSKIPTECIHYAVA